ncbi:tetratricopeptide repeat protein [Cognatilysobacter tabacisoli]|uniref:tetratricopeptide repeat protein n=1 Tax=Cognatilysobacter tabacisoli TaxID=2315424 RepID=UPI000E6B0170|nr:tetratricopeptide repeat protein [Lysobacter tabacisoli]
MPDALRLLSSIAAAAWLAAAAPAVHAQSAPADAKVSTAKAARAADDPTATSLEPLLAGEFALQAGKLDEAARHYLQAARAAGDPALAERATRIAVLAKDDAGAAEALALWRRLGGSGPSLVAADATLALHRGDERAARRHLNALLREPGDDGWRLALGVLGTGANDPKQAARLLDTLVDDGRIPNRLPAWLAFGGLAQRLEQPALAERIVAEVLERFPGEPRVALLRASQLRDTGRPDEAKAALALIADRADTDADLRLALAAEYEALDDHATAAQVLARGPQDDQTYALRASLLARAEDKTRLTALYDELARGASRPDPQRRLLLGQIAEFLDRNDDALSWYGGVPGGQQRWVARLRSANVLHELKRADQAYASLRELQADAAAPDDARRDAYLLESELRQRDKALDGELDAFARGLAAFPDDPDLLYARALAYERRDDIPRAEADLRRILVSDPDSVAALNALGYTLADRTTRYQEALEMIDRARTAQPDNAAIIDSYGWVLYRLGRNEEALVELRRAFTMQKDAEIAAHLGEVLWVLGRKDEARRYFDEARKLDADNRSLKRALEKLGL